MGEWFDPQPTAQELADWGITGGTFVNVPPRWPHPNTNRVKGMFCIDGSWEGIFTAVRWILNVKHQNPGPPVPPQVENVWCWLDLDVVAENHLAAELPGEPNEDATLLFSIKRLYNDPFWGRDVIEFSARLTQSSGEWIEYFMAREIYPNPSSHSWFYVYPTIVGVHARSSGGYTGQAIQVLCASVTDCYEFERSAQVPIGAEIRPNQWINFPSDLPHTLGPIRVEFNIRSYVNTDMFVTNLVRFSSNYGGFNGVDKFRWWDEIIPISPSLPLNQFVFVEMEYNWSVQNGAFMVWLDGQLVATDVRAAQNNPFDNIGPAGGVGPNEFDLHGFKQWSGSAVSPILDVDLPLIDDACDLGRFGLKGTTHNMALPSCP